MRWKEIVFATARTKNAILWGGWHRLSSIVQKFSSISEIERTGRGLLDRSLPKSERTHAAHFAAALWLFRRPDTDVMRDMPRLIRAYNEATGVHNTDTSGYHETITIGCLLAAHA